MPSAGKLRLQELATKYGLANDEIARLQDHGLLKPRQDNDGFYYSPRDEVRLQIAVKGLRLGLTLREIAAAVVTIAGLSGASLMIHQSNLCPLCWHGGTPCLEIFCCTVI